MSTIRVKPVDGVRIRDPQTKTVLPPEGMEVTNEPYWRRRIAAGDVVVVVDEPVAAAPRARAAELKRTGGDA